MRIRELAKASHTVRDQLKTGLAINEVPLSPPVTVLRGIPKDI